ncbi:MAG: phosphotransferase family protein [Candidatus Nanohalobium sp.]
MSELPEEKARELAEKIIREKGLENLELETGSEESSNNIFGTQDLFIKIEKYGGMRKMTYQEPVILEEIELKVKTPELKDYGHIDGYLYRIFEKARGEKLDTLSPGKTFYDLDRDEQKEKLRNMGENLAKIHESKAFHRFGTIHTMDGEIKGASRKGWSQGLRDIQEFWHGMLRDEDFDEEVDELEAFYSEKEELLDSRHDPRLIHQEMDFRNLLFQEEEICVVDWEAAAAGDPLMDIILLETIIFWLEDEQDEELRKTLRDGYRSIRPLQIDKGLETVYRAVELSRLLYVFQNDDERVKRILKELETALNS